MEYEVDYLDKFLQAMKEWKLPSFEDVEKRKRVENQIKDTLVSERAVKTKSIKDWDDDDFGQGIGLLCLVGKEREIVFFVEYPEENKTKVWWIEGGFVERPDQCLLREINGFPYKIKELLDEKRDESYEESDLW